jgi:8-oxo-dGTP diphosphatase
MSKIIVVAAVIERGGRILICQRPQGVGHEGRWEFPGGKREPGEGDRSALRRELREELGIDLAVDKRIWMTQAGPLELRFFRCKWRPLLRPRPLESAQFRWVKREDLPGYDFPPADSGLVKALAAGRFRPRR